MQSQDTALAIVHDPRWLAHRYDEKQDMFRYRLVERPQHRQAAFLTDEYLGPGEEMSLSRTQVRGLTSTASPLHFIFHSAFCASTMLVRALDQPGSAMGLSEPVLLNDMVGWLRRGADARAHGRVMEDALAQLGRPFEPGEAVVVKPSNVFNRLAAGALHLRPDARAVLLYAPLPEFLLSVARKGLWCRLWVRELLEGQLDDGLVDLGFEPRDYFRLSDLQVAAVGWLAQQALFARLLERYGNRLRTLDSDRLTRDPINAVVATAQWFKLKASSPVDYQNHPALGRDSKTGAAFAPGQRQIDQQVARRAYGDEIDKVAVWAEAVATARGIPMALSSPV